MNINDYLQNPYGKGSSFSNFSSQKEKLEKEYNDYASKFACKIYKYQNSVIFHVIVPSVKKDFISYDVILEINYDTKTGNDVDATGMEFKCFSNCPSFIFTYANAFKQKDLLCKWLENKYKKEVKKNTANIKNQYGIIGLERSLYLACLYLKKSGKSRSEVISTTCKKVTSYKQIADGVRSQDEIMEKSKMKIDPTVVNNTSGLNDIKFQSKKKESTRKTDSAYTKTTSSSIFTSKTTNQKKTTKSNTIKKTRRI